MEAIRNDPSMMAKLLECMQNPANMMKYLFYQYKYKWSDEWQVYEWSAYIEASEQVFLKNVPVYRWNTDNTRVLQAAKHRLYL